MRKMLLTAMVGISFLSGACSVTQIMQDNVSFNGLTTFYVELPEGGSKIVGSYSSAADVDAMLISDISEFLQERGYRRVDNKADAQIIFRPLWSASVKPKDIDGPIYMSETSTLGSSDEFYATLEIQAILPDGDIWAWRGFSPIEMTSQNISANLIREQVRWCLKYFPPEKFPSTLEVQKAERIEKENAADQNEFKEVLIRERAKLEAEANGDK